MIPLQDVVGILNARADELNALAAEHRSTHARRETKSVRAKYAAQARELRRMADLFAAMERS